MLVAERYEKIVEWVDAQGSMRVTELSERCGVTEETIRRDLDKLEQAGRLRRSHGGAVSVKYKDELQSEIPYPERAIAHAEEKRRIAEEAVKLVEHGDRIALDASTTAWYMAAGLPNIPLTVLTNSIKVAAELSTKEQIRVIATGGQLASKSLSFVGPLAERSLDAYHVDKVFLSCKGVHLSKGISESNELQALVKQKMIHIADEVILLADSSKFNIQAFTRVAAMESVHKVITDQGVLEEHVDALNELHITCIRV
ncbi:DeoR/GlpR family DNA-binding transcription regulator [Paenibacillus silvae]|jgi:DeoR/GlpR family transcriptional regulator of sugar metabolism|uniref:DeoR/GlpR family DNA-binding transcription regulator n=1 Tax=Paenibacillus TaxID=44249 RepID=UPI001C107515|nr:DeoR/GlpR family DNA-binding transcription regulator [Paenibacillus barcinonensis]MBU5351215.1 DeoR/GlpR family DNA-binding transcription regulator [Paenibacillus barcinonensis]